MLQTMEIKTTGIVKSVKPVSGKVFTLSEMQTAVNGLIELIYMPRHKAYMVVNEEGRLMGLPVNSMATHILGAALAEPVIDMVGDVLIIQTSEIE